MSVPISPPKKNEWAILVATALLVLLPLVVLGVYVAKKHMWAESMLSQMEPRFARLKGLDLQRDDIDKALARAAGPGTEADSPAPMGGSSWRGISTTSMGGRSRKPMMG